MPPEGHDKCRGAARRRRRTTNPATSGSTRSNLEQQGAQEQQRREEREERFAHTNIFKSRLPHEAEQQKKDEAHSGQPSNPSTIGPLDQEAKPPTSQNTGTQCPPPPTTFIYRGASGGFAEDLVTSGAIPPQITLQQNTAIAHPFGSRYPKKVQDPSNRAVAPQQDLEFAQKTSSSGCGIPVSTSRVGSISRSCVVQPSPSLSLPPSEPLPDIDGGFKRKHYSLRPGDDTNHATTGSTVHGPNIIPDIAPPRMFPSATAISKTAIFMKADGSCLFHALAGQICHDPNRADEVREAIVNFMAGNRDVFQALLPLSDIHPSQSDNGPLDRNENAQLDEYLRLLAKTRVWGGEPEIHAAAQHFGVTIMVHQEKGNTLGYNDGIGGNAAHIGYSKQYNHYYSVRDNDQILLNHPNCTTNAVDPEALLCDDQSMTSSRLYTFVDYSIDMDPLGTVGSARRPWPADQTERLLQMRNDGFSWKEIHAAFPDRTLGASQHRWEERWMVWEARQVRSDHRGLTGTGRGTWKRWTPAEEEVLQRLRDTGCTWDSVLEALPGRTISAVRKHCAELGTRQAKAVELVSALTSALKKRCAIPIEGSTAAPLKKRARVVAQNIHAAEIPLFAEPNTHSTRAVQEASEAAIVAEAAPSAETCLLAGKPSTDVEIKAPLPLNSELTKTGRDAHELRMPRKGVHSIRWTLSDEQLLSKMKDAGHSWVLISKALPNNRSERSVSEHWKEMQKGNSRIKRGWSTDENQRVKRMRESGAPWREISKAFPDRTPGALTSHWKGMKRVKLFQETSDIGVGGVTLASQNPNVHIRRVHASKRSITERRIKTKWRHALRHPNLAAYRKEVEALDESHIKLARQDRLKEVDEIDKHGSIEQKRVCLVSFLVHRKYGILPMFYSSITKTGIRYPGDGGPGPEVETDHESVEGELEDRPMEAQISRPKRGRYQRIRRQTQHASRARRPLRTALMEGRKKLNTDARTFIDLNELGMALGKTWPIQPSFQIVIDLLQRIRDGREAEGSLLTLDTEFISFTRRVLEVAVGEVHSGKVLIDVRVDHQCSTEELLKLPDGRPMGLKEQRISFQSLRQVYGSTDSEKCSGKKTAREIAEMLKSAGVSQKSIILVWHVNRFDLTILRELLESKGYIDILPPQGNCIPMIKHYRAGLPPRDKIGRVFISSLDQLFPLLFPRHQLVGMNHNAMPDIEMLRLMVLLLVQLQNPPARRELKEFPIATQEFVRSAKTPYNFLEKWLEIPDFEIPDNIQGKDDGDGEENEEDGTEGDGDEGD